MIVKKGSKVFIKNKNLGKYLFLLRDDKLTIPNPNTWSLLGGGIEEKETPLEAITREVKEEANITIYNLREIGNLEVSHVSKENGKEQIIKNKVYFFLAQTNADLKEAKIYEGQRLEYFTIEEVKRLNNLAIPIREAIEEYEELLK